MIPALEAEAGDLCELEASLVYRVSSRTAEATQRNPVLGGEIMYKNKFGNNNNN